MPERACIYFCALRRSVPTNRVRFSGLTVYFTSVPGGTDPNETPFTKTLPSLISILSPASCARLALPDSVISLFAPLWFTEELEVSPDEGVVTEEPEALPDEDVVIEKLEVLPDEDIDDAESPHADIKTRPAMAMMSLSGGMFASLNLSGRGAGRVLSLVLSGIRLNKSSGTGYDKKSLLNELVS